MVINNYDADIKGIVFYWHKLWKIKMTPDMQELYVETQTRTNCNSLFSRQISLAKSQLRERQNRKGCSLTSNVSRKSTCFHLHKIEFILHNVGMKSGLWHSLTAVWQPTVLIWLGGLDTEINVDDLTWNKTVFRVCLSPKSKEATYILYACCFKVFSFLSSCHCCHGAQVSPDLLVHIANNNNCIILNVHYNVHIVCGVYPTLLSFIPSDALNGLFIYA